MTACTCGTRSRLLRTTKQQRDAWRKLRENGMTSAVGEYTPAEFWLLLEDVEQLERELTEERERKGRA